MKNTTQPQMPGTNPKEIPAARTSGGRLAHWSWDETDRAAAAKVAARLPRTVFDFHAHIYRHEDLGGSIPDLLIGGPAVAGIPEWRSAMARLIGNERVTGGLFFPFPIAGCNTAAANGFLLRELESDPGSRGLILTTPDMTRKDAEKLLAHPQFVGFKPYHVFSSSKPTFQAPLSTYLPNWAWDLAQERQLLIMLHIVRDRALADPENQREIIENTTRHPSARLILAHAARGFHPQNTVEGLPSLRGIENIWFDASGICEPAALAAVINAFGPRRLLWGGDYPITERRGKCVAIGDLFSWINPEAVDLAPGAPAVHTYPAGIENIQAVLDAADQTCLNEEDLKDIFERNARRLLGMDPAVDDKTQSLYRHARNRIPGGVHLLSKRPEMFAPDQWPPYFREARGCEIWDLDDRHYYDMGINSVGACLLGYADPDVSRAVERRVRMGSMCSLNAPEEVELADKLCAIHPWASRVRLARTGGELAAVAVRIARATTDRSAVAICGYHGWADWYLAANMGDNDSLRGHLLPGLDPFGVPRELRSTTFPFTYNDKAALAKIIKEQGSRLAAVVMEPCRSADPDPGFLEFVREETRKAGILLIFDEITIGWRLHHGGAHLRFGIEPDMAMFAKALGNGHPIAAVIGTEEAMEGAHSSFISSAYWTESVGPVAACATLEKLAAVDAVGFLAMQGTKIQGILREAAAKHKLPVTVKGYPCMPSFAFDHAQANAIKTLYIQTMLGKGFLATLLIFVTMAHTDAVLDKFASALDETFSELADAIAKNDVTSRLKGPEAHQGFGRLI